MTAIFQGIPLIESNEEFEKLKMQEEYKDYDLNYLCFGSDPDDKKFFTKLYEENVCHLDHRDQINDQNMRKKFHPVAWEMACCDLLKNEGYELAENDRRGGPDIKILAPDPVYVECISVEDGKASIPRLKSIPGVVVSGNVPMDKMLSRITHGIYEKFKKYENNYSNMPHIDTDLPYVIAINSSKLWWPQDIGGVPLVFKGLSGFNHLQFDQYGGKSVSFRESIDLSELFQREEQSSLTNLDIFCDNKADLISGIIWTGSDLLSLKDTVPQKTWFINNPFAKNPLEENFLEGISRIKMQKNKGGVSFTFLPVD